jgi:hypothetical protein
MVVVWTAPVGKTSMRVIPIVGLMLATIFVSTASELASASALQFVCTYPKFFAWKDANPVKRKTTTKLPSRR